MKNLKETSREHLLGNLLKLTDVLDQWWFPVEDQFGTEIANELGEAVDRRNKYFEETEKRWKEKLAKEKKEFLEEFYSNNENKEWADSRRIEYLYQEKNKLEKKLDDIGDCIVKNPFFENILLEKANEIDRKISKTKGELKFKFKKTDNDGITDDMIEQAKQYPIKDLLGEPKMNKYLCLWHDDKNPSMHYYESTNTVYCFSCNKSGDSIDVYMELNHCEFPEAVKKLNY